jgi:hypothetical protein
MIRTFARVVAVLLLAGLGSVVGVTGASAQAPSTHPITPFAGEFHPIKNVDSNKCLQPQSPTFRAPVVQVTCNGSSAQTWAALNMGNNHYRFINSNDGGGLCLWVDDNPMNGAAVLQDECAVPGGTSVSNAEWNTGTTLPDVVRLRTLVNFRDHNLCLDAPGGLAMQVRTCSSSLTQRWVVGFTPGPP